MNTKIRPHTHVVKLIDRPLTHAASLQDDYWITPCGQQWYDRWYRVEVVGSSQDEPTCKTCRRRLRYES